MKMKIAMLLDKFISIT